jgi:formyl-CoA transferase
MPAKDGVQARYTYYQTRDHKYILFCPEEKQFWLRFCDAISRPDLAARHDDSVVTDFGNDLDLLDELQKVFHTRTQVEWVELFRDRHVPGAPALALEELSSDPHVTARAMLLTETHPVAGSFTTLGNPIQVQGCDMQMRIPAPALGEHTEMVLAELGYDRAQRAALREAGVVGSGPENLSR